MTAARLQKGGPRTPEGRAASSRNSLRHGIFAREMPIPGVEDEECWRLHCAGVAESLSPQSYVEAALAYRIADLLWRLGRVARFERGQITRAVANADIDLDQAGLWGATGEALQPPTVIRARIITARNLLELCDGFIAGPPPDRREIPADSAVAFLERVHDTSVSVISGDAGDLTFPDTKRDPFARVLVKDIESTLRAWSLTTGNSIEDLVRPCQQQFADDLSMLTSRLAEAETALQRRRSEMLMPDEGVLERVIRYEAHLNRQVTATLTQLETLRHLCRPTRE